MALLSDHRWKTKYTPDDGSLVQRFYLQALDAAVRYDRTTGFFSASALALAARGIEALVRNSGKMRLLVGCTLEEAEADAIAAGYDLRETIAGRLMKMPLLAEDADHREALELLSWMVAKGYLDVKVAIPRDEAGRPLAGVSLFHEKSGIIEDKTGDRLAFSGSVNETARGWKLNWESFHVFCSWMGGDAHIAAEEESFARLWEGRSPRAWVVDVPEAIEKSFLPFLPADAAEPVRVKKLQEEGGIEIPAVPAPPSGEAGLPDSREQRRRELWDFIHSAAARPDGARVGEATSAVVPWPHQIRAFHRMYSPWQSGLPPRLLIADEVGLGKTIEAGLLLRQAWLSGRARRILILAPKAVLTQWQIELREKFNLDWPIYDGDALVWQSTPVHREGITQPVSRREWHKAPCVIASSHLMRRRERQTELILDAEPWDLVVLDEAHHARRKNPGAPGEGGPNLLLRLMQGIVRQERTQGLILLTATPMQVHPVEVWDLISLLGLPEEWSAQAFLEYFRLLASGNPSHVEFDKLARLFQAMERRFGETPLEVAQGLVEGSRVKAKRLLAVLRDPASTPRRQLSTEDRRAAMSLLRVRSPVATLISRHTRDLLRAYFKAGKIATPIAERKVLDQFLPMAEAERAVYEAVEDYISSTYKAAAADEKTSVGFVMTIYRRRLSSSFAALTRTLETRLAAISGEARDLFDRNEDLPDDEIAEDVVDAEDAETMERQALQREEKSEIARLLAMARALPTDTKARALFDTVNALAEQGYAQAIVFTQYTDTLNFLRDYLVGQGLSIMCFSGRGGEVMLPSGDWKTISREETKHRFRNGNAQVLLCTDAAAEGLNFQFCGALVNYDAPWNPMRVEQRIGRIDRLGQKFEKIAIVNLMYTDTVEADVYAALRNRIGLFTSVIGRLQPILSRLPHRIAEAALAGREERVRLRANLLSTLEGEVAESEREGFDIDSATQEAMTVPALPAPPLTMATLGALLDQPEMLPPAVQVERLSAVEFSWRAPGMPEALRITTDLAYYEDHPSSVEFWSAGSPLFPAAAG